MGEPTPVPPAFRAAVDRFFDLLRGGTANIISTAPMPPADADLIEASREDARAAAEALGLGPALAAAQHEVAEWVLEQYRRLGFQAAYLSGWLDDPAQRLEVVDMVVDAATAFVLFSHLSEETIAGLTARFPYDMVPDVPASG
jgi:hypothetical protein